jgi:hypothetical protein
MCSLDRRCELHELCKPGGNGLSIEYSILPENDVGRIVIGRVGEG